MGYLYPLLLTVTFTQLILCSWTNLPPTLSADVIHGLFLVLLVWNPQSVRIGRQKESIMALSELATIAVLLATAAYLFYYNYTKHYRRWRNVPGVPSLKPSFPFGNMGDLYMQRKSDYQAKMDVIDELKGHRYVLTS